MTRITKEHLQQIIDGDILFTEGQREMARMLMASIDSAQEPVAWLWRWSDDAEGFWRYSDERKETKGSVTAKPLYAAPPSLTDAERAELQEYRKAANAAVAWLWSHRKHKSEVTLIRPEDDERAEGALWSGWTCQPLAPVRPTPVLPDEKHDWQINEFSSGWNACRSAMIQGAKS